MVSEDFLQVVYPNLNVVAHLVVLVGWPCLPRLAIFIECDVHICNYKGQFM